LYAVYSISTIVYSYCEFVLEVMYCTGAVPRVFSLHFEPRKSESDEDWVPSVFVSSYELQFL